MTVTKEKLLEFGYRQIRSDLHAAQILRRELKFQQRRRDSQGLECVVPLGLLLKIKPGNWYKLRKCNYKQSVATLVW